MNKGSEADRQISRVRGVQPGRKASIKSMIYGFQVCLKNIKEYFIDGVRNEEDQRKRIRERGNGEPASV